MNVILMGYRGTGKTSAGLALAALLGYSLIDTDALVRRRTGQTVEQIVTAGGWEAFRAAERAAVAEAAAADGAVIALGGGAILDPQNVAALKDGGLFVWLTADPATILRRLEQDPDGGAQRPSLSGRPVADEVTAILAEREPIYRACADLVVDTTNRTAAEVAAAIRTALEARQEKGEPARGAAAGEKEG